MIVTDESNGNEVEMVVTGQNRLSQESVHRMVKQAEEFVDEDARFRQSVIAQNRFESYVYGVKNAIKDESNSAELSDKDKNIILAEVHKAKAFIKENTMHFKASKEDFDEAQQVMEKVVAPIMSKFRREIHPSGNKDGGSGHNNEF